MALESDLEGKGGGSLEPPVTVAILLEGGYWSSPDVLR